MSTPIDYLSNAAERIAVAVTHPNETQAQTVAMIAQAEATLALAQQQRISNLIAISASPRISIESRNWAANEALKALGVPATHSDEPSRCVKCGGPAPFHDPACIVHPGSDETAQTKGSQA